MGMDQAHASPRGVHVCEYSCTARVRGEFGFSIVELLVVMVIIATVLAIVLPSVQGARRAPDGPGLEVAASALWRATSRYRVDHRGEFPPSSTLINASNSETIAGASSALRSSLKSSSGEPYLATFPSLPTNSSRPLPIRAAQESSSSTPYLVYTESGLSGRIEAYDNYGKRRWCRSVSSIDPSEFEVGGSGQLEC